MTNNKSQETITTYVTDMHALVTHGLQAITRQRDNLKDSKGHPEALAAIQDFHQTLTAHLPLLEARARSLGGSTTQPVKDAVSAVAGVAAGLVNAVRAEEASKSIRDDYAFLSLLGVSYLMLHTTAAGLNDHETATLAERGYRDAARMVMAIDRVMPVLVLQELRQDGLPVREVSQECGRMVKNSWERGGKEPGASAASMRS